MRLFLRLALRNVFRNRARTVVALLAIAAGCAALIVNGGVIYDIFERAARGRDPRPPRSPADLPRAATASTTATSPGAI